MKRIIKICVITSVAIICLTACKEPYAWYIVEGRLIDKTTKEPVKDIMVSPIMYNTINQKSGQKTKKMDQSLDYDYSDTNGEFRTSNTYNTSLLYISGYSSYENSLYKDTTISVDFSNVPLSGKPSRNYKGDYVLNIGDIELERIK